MWKGDSEHLQNRILEALSGGGIPSRYKIPVEFEVKTQNVLVGRSVTTLKLSYEVWVLRKDFRKARKVVSELTQQA
jgi:hypothetical protein